MSPAVMRAVTWALLMNVDGRPEPFHRTSVPGSKLTPFTVRVNPGPPAKALAGTSEVIDAVGVSAICVAVVRLVRKTAATPSGPNRGSGAGLFSG